MKKDIGKATEEFAISEIKRVVSLLGREDLTRGEFLKYTPLNDRDINELGGYPKLFHLAGYQPVMWHALSDDELFQEYEKIVKKIGHFPLGTRGRKEIDNNSKYRWGTFSKRFKGLRKFAIEYLKWSKKKLPLKVEQGKILSPEKSNLQALSSREKEIIPKAEPKTRMFYGSAAEYLVVAELIFRGFNAQILPVDTGLDVIATREKEPFFVQVKHSEYGSPDKSNLIKLTISSLMRHQSSKVYYIIVLSRREPSHRDFLILPFLKLNELESTGVLQRKDKAKQISFRVIHTKKDDAYINKESGRTDVSRYLNAWDVIR